MAYATGEGLLLTVVQAMTGFDSTSTSQADWSILNKGTSDHYAILRPGPFVNEPLTPTLNEITWTTVIEVWQQYTDDGTTATNLYGHVDNMLNIRKYKNFSNSAVVANAILSGGDEPEEMWNSGGGPQWLRWKMNVTWKEQECITYVG